mgnify:CR=1 FL=1
MFESKINKMPAQLINELEEGLSIFSQLNHSLFVKLIGYSPVDFKNKQHPVVVSEMGSDKTLKRVILMIKERQGWDETDKHIILYGIAYGMQYLHSKGIIHRNLNINAIFLNESFHPKISNLEFLKKISDKSTKEDEYFLGIYSYSAPEIFQKKYSKYSDVYAFSMIAYEMLAEREVYDNVPTHKIQNETLNGKRPEFTSDVPSCYQKLIEECWSNEASKRPLFDEIVERLKTDEFINEKIDKNKFMNYVESLERTETYEIKSSEEKEKVVHSSIKEETKSNESRELKFKKVSVDFDQNKEALKDDQKLNVEFLDLKKFKLDEIIGKQDHFKIYKVVSKETDEIFSAKISTVRMNALTRDELISLSREVNIISQLHHPSFLKFIGYSPFDFKNKHHPVIITERAMNGTLRHILDCERESIHISQWNETTKLITHMELCIEISIQIIFILMNFCFQKLLILDFQPRTTQRIR